MKLNKFNWFTICMYIVFVGKYTQHFDSPEKTQLQAALGKHAFNCFTVQPII